MTSIDTKMWLIAKFFSGFNFFLQDGKNTEQREGDTVYGQWYGMVTMYQYWSWQTLCELICKKKKTGKPKDTKKRKGKNIIYHKYIQQKKTKKKTKVFSLLIDIQWAIETNFSSLLSFLLTSTSFPSLSFFFFFLQEFIKYIANFLLKYSFLFCFFLFCF